MKPSAVFFIAVDLLRSLGKRFPSSASFSPASGMWAATYTNPATDGSVSGCFVPTLYDFLCECRVQVHPCTDHMGSDLDLAPVKNFEEPRQTLLVAVVVPFARRQIWILRIDLRHRAFGSAGRLCAALHLHRDHASAIRPKGACGKVVLGGRRRGKSDRRRDGSGHSCHCYRFNLISSRV